jgi:chromosome segregation ATPase
LFGNSQCTIAKFFDPTLTEKNFYDSEAEKADVYWELPNKKLPSDKSFSNGDMLLNINGKKLHPLCKYYIALYSALEVDDNQEKGESTIDSSVKTDLENKIKELEDKNNSIQKEKETIQSQLNNLENDVKSNKVNKTDFNDLNSKYQNSLKTLNETQNLLTQEKDSLKEINRLNEQLKNTQEKQSNEIKQLKDEDIQQNKKIQSLENDKIKLTEDIKTEINKFTKLDEQTKDSIAKANNAIATAQTLIQRQNAENKKLKSQNISLMETTTKEKEELEKKKK